MILADIRKKVNENIYCGISTSAASEFRSWYSVETAVSLVVFVVMGRYPKCRVKYIGMFILKNVRYRLSYRVFFVVIFMLCR